MKFRFYPSALACATLSTIAYSAPLGKVMYVGDSITHGAYETSYRWDMHKILVDNGLEYTPIGIMEGDYYAKPQSPDSYGAVAFINVHNAESGGTAAAVAGAEDDGRNKYGDSNITNWMGQSAKTADGTPYEVGETMPSDAPSGFDPTLQVFKGKDAPARFMMMIGTNDLDASWNSWDGRSDVRKLKDIAYQLDNMEKIYQSVRSNNKHCVITLGGVPVWASSKSWKVNDKGRLAVLAYNQALKEWAEKRRDKNLFIADVNAGLVDVSLGAENFKGVPSMFNDGLHTSYQGNLIIAGNFAKAQGIAGATAGQARKATQALKPVPMTKGDAIAATWDKGEGLSKGATLDVQLSLGNGEQGGWDTEHALTITMGDDSRSGSLSINETFIMWGSKILYSLDMSACTDSIRLAWVNGEPDKGLKAGFYVWLGDQLIGEALPAQAADGTNGVKLSYDGKSKLGIKHLALDGTGSFAPATQALTDPKASYHAVGGAPTIAAITAIDWQQDGSVTWMKAQGKAMARGADYYARPSLRKKSEGDISIALHAGKQTTPRIYANAGDYTGNCWLDIKAGSLAPNAASWYAAYGSASAKTGMAWTLDGNALLKFSGKAQGGKQSSVIGAINAGKVTGSIYLEFDADALQLGNGFKGFNASVAAGYNSQIEGDVRMLFKAGQFDADVLGGMLSKNDIGGSTLLTIIGGRFGGDIYAAGRAGNIAGSSTLVIEGSKAIIHDGDKWGKVVAGPCGGSVSGTQSIILNKIKSSELEFGFDQFAGTLSGGESGTRQLIFNEVVLDNFAARIENFDVMSLGEGTHLTLSNPAGVRVKTLILDSKLSLTIAKGSSFTVDKFGSVFVSFEGCSLINHGELNFTKDTLISPKEISELITGDGRINMRGEWDISMAVAGGKPLADLGQNTLIITPELCLNLGQGLKQGRFPLFKAAKVDLPTGAIKTKGLGAGQDIKLSFDADSGILYAEVSK
ncbi:MAG: GDSL-type esterase/lipase family protein [Akkermansia sp.]